MTLRYNANLVADGAKKDGDGNTISSTYAKSANLSTVATSGDYDDLTNKPTIPAAQVQADWSQSDNTAVDYIKNKPTIPSGVIVDQTYDGTSTNAQSGVAIEGAGFLTGITSSDVTNALGFTPYDSSNPSGYTSNVGTVTSVNNITPVNGNVTLSIPQEIFLATYGTTTYQDVLTAYNAGKIIKCLYEYSSTLTFELSLVFNNTQTSSFFFAGTPDVDGTYRIANLSSTAGWNSYTSIELEKVSHKVTSISSSSTDTQYPSAKAVFELLKAIYPVGSVYLSTNSTCPMANLFGTWTLVSSGKALWTGDGTNGDTTIAAGLPNITGNVGSWQFTSQGNKCTDCFEIISYSKSTYGGSSAQENSKGASFDASRVSSIYSNDVTTVQPPAYVVNVWKRTA